VIFHDCGSTYTNAVALPLLVIGITRVFGPPLLDLWPSGQWPKLINSKSYAYDCAIVLACDRCDLTHGVVSSCGVRV
jgi:hypothetical protein